MSGSLGSFPVIAGLILMANTFLLIILTIVCIVNTVKVRRLTKRYEKFMSAGFNEKNLEQLIDACIFKAEDAYEKNREIQNTVTKLEANMLKCIQKVGFIRYSAFENVGSDQSFSVALLDTTDNGIVISGIYSRENPAVFAKTIEGGKSKYTLTTEEIQVVDRAKRAYGERMYTDVKTTV